MKQMACADTVEAAHRISNREQTVRFVPESMLRTLVAGEQIQLVSSYNPRLQLVLATVTMVDNRTLTLADITVDDVARCGFHGIGVAEFVSWWRRRWSTGTEQVRRLEWEYQ